MKPKRGSARHLAASIVVTFAVAPGCRSGDARKPESCEPPDCHMNPPPPEPPTATIATTPSATVAATATIARTPSATPSVTPSATVAATASSATAPIANLPPGMFMRDGQCWQQQAPNCPPYDPKHPRTCNPPAPTPVPCPAE